MNPEQKRERILLQLETTAQRHRWAKKTAKTKGTTQALIKFTRDCLGELNQLKAKVAYLNRLLKLEKLSKAIKISR
jgi:hypothetical protein